MPVDVLLALAAFAVTAAVTPGPNNIMLLASGVNFGFTRTIPHMAGILFGFIVMLSAVGAGLGVLFKTFPLLHTVLKVAGVVYLVYLAWRVAMSRSMGDAKAKARPMSLIEAAAFQWVNPKAWVMGVTAMSVYTRPDAPLMTAAIVVAVFAAVTVPAITLWAVFGTGLRDFLSDPVRLKWFNIAMGLALVASVAPMLR
ncbi:MAG: LysE family translocator [Rhodobiaceae bacterium]|nr:LysE family translocator [Rhodobiaceae bacterium]MCC0012059.1 LysE family translocator [Rhodobiaceae bacterium]MCC0051526.1 LysE family translocator [Rhodobiaceae bacterium]MCC0061025.1 LysE family translocator [Rhodobiaceae bacterium]